MTKDAGFIDRLEKLYEEQGCETYLGESISIADHMLQCAQLAEEAGDRDEVIAAALLHDIGHFLEEHRAAEKLATHDCYHQYLGADFLSANFPASVVSPVRHHVAAKRYLCAVDSAYHQKLSFTSVETLKLQGGAMSGDECLQFEKLTDIAAVIRVRQYDDAGKQTGCRTPRFGYYAGLLSGLLC